MKKELLLCEQIVASVAELVLLDGHNVAIDRVNEIVVKHVKIDQVNPQIGLRLELLGEPDEAPLARVLLLGAWSLLYKVPRLLPADLHGLIVLLLIRLNCRLLRFNYGRSVHYGWFVLSLLGVGVGDCHYLASSSFPLAAHSRCF